MEDKTFKTYNQQLRILRARGLDTEDGTKSKKILETENYYNLINGYKDLFLDKTASEETYKAGAKLSEIYALCEFDREMRSIFLKRILKFETHIKSTIAYEFSCVYSHDNYLKIANFNQGTKNQNLGDISKLIASIQNDIARQINKNNSVNHYMETYGYVPLWVLVNILTLGTISKFYGLMKLQERQKVAKRFCVSEKDLRSYLKLIALFRNLCAHDERFYNFKSGKIIIAENRIHHSLQLPKRKGTYQYGVRDVFALLIALELLLAPKDAKALIKDIKEAVGVLAKKIGTISIENILEEMGFPSNWKEIEQL
ncbi:MAG: Abi family protein [Clostridiaceae bacterium]|nr:Abi family protein [Clostridiaceae bacterium]